ncbi:hypothetical protein [Curtobacterium sp. MCBA15_009]|uniref:hypothetical protein n=1 Tax=Curtobacterium sp. MCBA15_009 TaxID=1898737 RepID=UPI001113DB24|nr:hypothetical protein [Curtobacterium sp. MCBA15_009]
MRRPVMALAAAGLGLALLTGCSSGGGSSDAASGGPSSAASTTASSAPSTAAAAPAQSREQACSVVEDEFKSFIAAQSSSTAPADAAGRAELVQGIADRMDEILPKVGNDDVRSAFEDFSDSARDYAEALEDSGSATSTEATEAQTDVQSTLAKVSKVCPNG